MSWWFTEVHTCSRCKDTGIDPDGKFVYPVSGSVLLNGVCLDCKDLKLYLKSKGLVKEDNDA